MNALGNRPSGTANDTFESRFALRLAARLDEHAQSIGPDLSERLRVSRERALEQARLARSAEAARSKTVFATAGAAILGGGGWWARLGLALPLVALLVGLAWIQQSQFDEQISAAADIDAALLADDVPPTAYSDPGFVEFLKTPRN